MNIHEGWTESTKLTVPEFNGELAQVCEDMRQLLVAKRESYGPFNLAKFGDDGILIRVSDKLERLIHMSRENLETTAVDESRIDAWRDIVGYGLLVLMADRLRQTPQGKLKISIESSPRHD